MRILSHLVATVIPLIVTSVVNAQPAGTPRPAPSDSPAVGGAPVEDLTQTVQTSPSVAEPAPEVTGQTQPSPSPTPAPSPMVTQEPMGPQSVQFSPTGATEQPAPTAAIHRGFYMRFGGGMGFVSMSGDGPRGAASIRGLGSLSTLALGGSIARGVVLGGAITSSGATEKFSGGPYEGRSIALDDRSVAASSKADAAFTQLGLFVDWFPDPTGGWHVGAAAGFGVLSVINRADDNTDNSMFGSTAGGSLFGGYDWSIGKAWSLGLDLTASGVKSMSLKYANDSAYSGYRMHCGSVGVQASILYF